MNCEKKRTEFKNQITRLQFLVTFSSYAHDNIVGFMLAKPLNLLATSVSSYLCHESANGLYLYNRSPIKGNFRKTKYYIYEGISISSLPAVLYMATCTCRKS